MASKQFPRIAQFKTVTAFRAYMQELGLDLTCDDEILSAATSSLAQPLEVDGFTVGNRWCIHPMEGWDGTADGNPSELTERRWRHFGESGAKLIWGGEAAAVRHDGRANPNQLMATAATQSGLAHLHDALLSAHQELYGTTDDLLVGLQLTHSGRFARPNRKDRLEPKIVYHHPILDRKFGITADYPVLTDGELREIIDCFVTAAKVAADAGFRFLDLKHCHGYLGHELLSGFTREGEFGGSLENRLRFLREITAGVRTECPRMMLGVRLSAFDMVPFRPDLNLSTDGKLGPGTPEDYAGLLPYRYGLGVDASDPTRTDLTETFAVIRAILDLGIRFLNITAGSPYYNPHIQRPALFPPSDGYQPPEDPLVGVARQIEAVRAIKQRFPQAILVGTGYTYLQEYLPLVAQQEVRAGNVDFVGIGRMVLSYPQMPHDVLSRGALDRKRICRTFSDCTTGPRHGMVSGCYPLDPFYKSRPEADRVKAVKAGA